MPPSGFTPIPLRLSLLGYLSQVLNCRGSLLTRPDSFTPECEDSHVSISSLDHFPELQTHVTNYIPAGDVHRLLNLKSRTELIICYCKPTGLSSQWKAPPSTLSLSWTLGHHHSSFLSLPHPVTYWLWNHLNAIYAQHRDFPTENLNKFFFILRIYLYVFRFLQNPSYNGCSLNLFWTKKHFSEKTHYPEMTSVKPVLDDYK